MVAGASGVVPPAADGAGEPGGNKVLAWQASSLEASSMLRMCRASGNSVRTEMRGWADDGGVSGRSRSVAARRTSRRRPSGKATAMKAGPRPQVNDSSLSTCPNKGCRGSVTVTLETIRSKLGADRSVRGCQDDHRAPRPAHPPLPHPGDRQRQLPLQEQLRHSSQARKEATTHLTGSKNPAPPSTTRVNSSWQSRVSSQWHSTSCTLAGCTMTASSMPMVSVSRWRLRPTIFLPAS
jgi:hypothetical protein